MPFQPGVSGNPNGRPKGSGKYHIRDMCWESINRVVQLVFATPEPEMVAYIKKNMSKLSRAEKVFLDKSKDIRTLELLMDRVIGRPTQIIAEAEKGDTPRLVINIPGLEGKIE